jgi:RNA polymerase sigma-70 factor (ECF subfamily)
MRREKDIAYMEGMVASVAEAERSPRAGDEQLVMAARRDPQAFTPLYQRYVGPIYRYCYLRLGDRTAAEDATSEVFTKALAALPGYRAGGSFAAWLFRIAQNVVHDVYRRAHPTATLETAGDPPDGQPSPLDAVITQAHMAAVREALKALPATQRRAVELQLAGWSVADSAAVLGISTGALKLLRFRALRRLRTLLAQERDGIPSEVRHDVE